MTLKWLAACFATSLTLSVAHAEVVGGRPEQFAGFIRQEMPAKFWMLSRVF